MADVLCKMEYLLMRRWVRENTVRVADKDPSGNVRLCEVKRLRTQGRPLMRGYTHFVIEMSSVSALCL